MTDYVYIKNNSNLGEIGMSRKVFEQIALEATNRIQGASVSAKKRFTLDNPIQVSFRKDGKVDVLVTINLKKGQNANDVCLKIQEEVANAFLAYAESVPFNIEIKVASIA